MAGGLAILLGTLLGINFPMGGQNTAQAPANGNKTSRVLPANINVNSTAASSTRVNGNGDTAAKNNVSDDTDTGETKTAQNTTTDSTITTDDTQSNETTQNNQPISALW
jgi:hypothetical protein